MKVVTFGAVRADRLVVLPTEVVGSVADGMR